MPSQPGAIQVTDRLERRIRKPIDLLRCVTSGIEIIVLAVAGVAASATTTGVGDRHRRREQRGCRTPCAWWPRPWRCSPSSSSPSRWPSARSSGARCSGWPRPWPPASWPRPWRRCSTPRCGAGSPTGSTTRSSWPGRAPATPRRSTRTWPALVAYATIIGLSGRPGWRNALWLAVGVYGARAPGGDLDTTLLSFLLTLLVGRTIGLGVRYAAGSPSLRPSAAEIAAALNSADRQVTEISRLRAGAQDPQAGRIAALRRDDEHRRPAGHHRLRPGPAGGRRLLPAVPVAPAARAGVARRAAVGGPDRGAPGAAVLRGRRRGRAHAPAARGGPGRTGSHRARLRSPRRDDAGRAESRVHRRRAAEHLGRRAACCTSTGSRTGR